MLAPPPAGIEISCAYDEPTLAKTRSNSYGVVMADQFARLVRYSARSLLIVAQRPEPHTGLDVASYPNRQPMTYSLTPGNVVAIADTHILCGALRQAGELGLACLLSTLNGSLIPNQWGISMLGKAVSLLRYGLTATPKGIIARIQP
jgi:hypothetical protein